MALVDQFSDPAFGTLYRQVKLMPALEEFVKQAEVDTSQKDFLPDSAFAWPAERKFPVHSAQHAALSYAYSKVASVLPAEVRSNIAKALEVYEVPETTFAEVAEKVASDDNYVLPEFKFLPLNTETQVKLAQDRLLEEIPKLTLENRALAASNLVKRADELKVALRPEVLQFAGLVVSTTKFATQWLEARATRLPAGDTVHKVAYQTLADHLKKGPEELADRRGLLKLAAAIADLDEQTGLDKHYDRKLPDALRTVFNSEKVASQSIDLGGRHVSFAKIAALPASFWEDLGGKELSDEIAPGGVVDQSKLAAVVDTLPLDLKLTLRAQCR
jgi:hypothetical protein